MEFEIQNNKLIIRFSKNRKDSVYSFKEYVLKIIFSSRANLKYTGDERDRKTNNILNSLYEENSIKGLTFDINGITARVDIDYENYILEIISINDRGYSMESLKDYIEEIFW